LPWITVVQTQFNGQIAAQKKLKVVELPSIKYKRFNEQKFIAMYKNYE
jgi:hypothetical protein